MDRKDIIDVVKNMIGIDDSSLNRIVFKCDKVIVYFFCGGVFYKVVIFLNCMDNRVMFVNCDNNIVCCYIYNFNYFL